MMWLTYVRVVELGPIPACNEAKSHRFKLLLAFGFGRYSVVILSE